MSWHVCRCLFSREVSGALFCLLLFMQNLLLLHQQLVIVLVARIRLLWILEVLIQLRRPFHCRLWRMDVKEKGFSRLTKFLQPPKLVDGIFEVSLRLQKFWWVQKIVRTRNGFALTDFLANQTKFRVVRTGQPDKHLTHLPPKTNFKGAVFLNESMNERTN